MSCNVQPSYFGEEKQNLLCALSNLLYVLHVIKIVSHFKLAWRGICGTCSLI